MLFGGAPASLRVSFPVLNRVERLGELGVFGGTTVPRKTLGSGARDGRDDTGLRIDLAHAVIVGVGNVDVPVAIERQLAGIVEPRRRRWASIPCVSVKRSL